MEIIVEDLFTEVVCGYAKLSYSESRLCQYSFTNILCTMSLENIQDDYLYDLTNVKYIDFKSEFVSSCIMNCAIEFEQRIPKHVYINDIEFTEYYWFPDTNKYIFVTGIYGLENSDTELIVEINLS